MRTVISLLVFLGVCMSHAAAQPQHSLNLMPMPSQVEEGSGQLGISADFSVALQGHREDRLERGVRRFLGDLSRRTAIPFGMQLGLAEKATLVIETAGASKEIQEPGEDESYSLEIANAGARITAANPLGALHGLQTFLQLVEPTPTGFAVPALTIHDSPRFVWRGLLIDVGRHFIPLDVIKRNLDGMAAVKMNVFHWHLSDYQGFRVESKKYPKLHDLGSDGLYYTQEEIRELIFYARERGIRVIPEFDIPGHSTSWFVGYPELASAPGPYKIERRFGVFDPAMDPTRDHVYEFLDSFIGEMAKLFPDPYFHIGGDEVNGKQWDANPKIQEFRRSHNIKSNQELQAHFTTRLQKIVSKHDKIMVGWDEILAPGMTQNLVIQSWRGQESLAAAAKQGYQGLLSNGYYIDLMLPASNHYAIDPLSGPAANLSAEEKSKIMGGEATMWSEFVSPETIDSRIWPRTAAIAERLWSPQDVRDVNSMYQRLDQISWQLDFAGLTHNTGYIPMLQRIANMEDVSALRTLTDVLEPVKEYTREDLARTQPTSLDPLNRLVDAVRPESETARVFTNDVDALIAGQCKDTAITARIRTKLGEWHQVQANLEPLLGKSFLLEEARPLAKNLSAVSGAGLEALDYIDRGAIPPDPWKAEHLTLLEQAKKPNSAQLLLMIVSPVQKLVSASVGGGGCAAAK